VKIIGSIRGKSRAGSESYSTNALDHTRNRFYVELAREAKCGGYKAHDSSILSKREVKRKPKQRLSKFSSFYPVVAIIR
jgi:hypothetical protein